MVEPDHVHEFAFDDAAGCANQSARVSERDQAEYRYSHCGRVSLSPDPPIGLRRDQACQQASSVTCDPPLGGPIEQTGRRPPLLICDLTRF
jgi:hypothetical protein